MILLGFVSSTCAVGTPACAGHADRADRESHEISIAIANPLPVPLARQTGIAIAMDRGIEPVSGTWIDRMNADDAGRMRVLTDKIS